MMKIILDDIRAAQSRRAQPQRAEDENHARAVALLEILNRQRGGGIGGLPSFTPSLPSDAPGQSAVRLGARQLGNAGFAAPQGNAPVIAEAGASPAIEVPFGADAFAAPVVSSAAPGGAPKQFGFGGDQTISNQPLHAGIFSAGGEVASGQVANDPSMGAGPNARDGSDRKRKRKDDDAQQGFQSMLVQAANAVRGADDSKAFPGRGDRGTSHETFIVKKGKGFSITNPQVSRYHNNGRGVGGSRTVPRRAVAWVTSSGKELDRERACPRCRADVIPGVTKKHEQLLGFMNNRANRGSRPRIRGFFVSSKGTVEFQPNIITMETRDINDF